MPVKMKVQFFIHYTNFSNHQNFLTIFKKLINLVSYRWKATADWNVKMEDILEKRRTKAEKKMKILKLFI